MLLQSFQEIFFKFSPWIVLLPTLIAISMAMRAPIRELRPVLGFLCLSVFTQALSFALWRKSINNLPLLHIYTIAEFMLLYWFYMSILGRKDKLMLIIAATVSVFLVFDSLQLESIWKFNIIGRSIEAFIFILLALAWFLKIVNHEFEYMNVNSLKYINAGLLVYFSGSIVLFSFSGFINSLAKPLAFNIWSIHTLLLVLLYAMLTIGLLKWKTS